METQLVVANEVASSYTPQKSSGSFREPNGRPSMVGGVAEYDGWRSVGLTLRAECEKNEGGIAWQAAKWLVDGYRTFLGPDASNQAKGNLIKEASWHSGLSRNTLIAYIKVGFAFPNGAILGLSFAHHRAVIAIPRGEDRGEDRAYWLRQAADKKMSVADLKKAIKDLIPSKPKVGINAAQEANCYAVRLRKLNPPEHVWDKIIEELDRGCDRDVYRHLLMEMEMYADRLFRNLRHLQGSRVGRPEFRQPDQNVKPPELVEAEKTEAIGAAVQAA
jgi:hypothetical protein